MDAHFRWFEGEKAQFRFVPYDWAFLINEAQELKLPCDVLRHHPYSQTRIDLQCVVVRYNKS